MGSEILTFYNEKLKKEWKLAFYSAFAMGLLVHLYKFTNLLPNHDSLYNFYSTQNMVASGRWFLSIACGLSSFFDLPWIIGLLSLVFMGITAAVVAEVFRMKNPVLIILSSALQVSFPAITATMAYEFTADGYMIAMALAALSVVLTRMEHIGRRHWPRMVLSAVCICLSCAIYQAYVSFAFVLAVCYFMMELLEDHREEKLYWKWIGTQVVVYICALAAYYVIWKLLMKISGISASGYLGIDQVGVMGGSQMILAVVNVIKFFIRFFLEWNILEYGVTVYSVLSILFLAAFAVCVGYAVWKSGCLKKKVHLILILLCLIALPFGCYIWMLASPGVYYRTLMLQSICLLYIFLAVICERWIYAHGKKFWSNVLLLLLSATVFNNALAANMSYTYMDQCYEKTYANAVELNTRVHLLDDGSIRFVALCGSLDPWGQEDYFDQEKLRQLGAWKHMDKTILTAQFLSVYTDFNLSYYRINEAEHPLVENEPNIPAPYDWEFRFPVLSAEDTLALSVTEQVQAMPVWPARDSVQVIGDTVVVKLSETEEMMDEE